MSRHIAANFLNLAILLLLVVAGIVLWGRAEYSKPGPLAESIFVEVPRGGTITGLARTLKEQGAISSVSILRVAADYSGADRALKFGNYEIPAGASMEDILSIVTKAGAGSYRYVANYRIGVTSARMTVTDRTTDTEVARFDSDHVLPAAYVDLVQAKTPISYRITVAEGVTSWQVAETLKAADFLDGSLDFTPAEGSLSPDTYEVRRGTLITEVLDQMTMAQTDTLAQAWAARQDGLPLGSPQEALILASIVEKETGIGSERPEVASVFVNRLRKGMKLQTDPTVIYGITMGQGTLGRGLRRSELQKRTDYNTYIIPALPPTPIANPGRAAIEAVLNPAETDFLFFVADGTGGHAFAKTLAEHNRNVREWRIIEAERRRQQSQSGDN